MSDHPTFSTFTDAEIDAAYQEFSEEASRATPNQDQILDALYEAEELLSQARELLEQAARLDKSNAGWARAYIINHLQAVIASPNRYDQDLQTWIKMVGGEEA